MKQRLLETVGRSARLKVLNELKRTTDGLPVALLAGRLGMSYMGVKDICSDLEKRGLLDTWRLPTRLGRPQMLYRLTAKAHELFPTTSNAFTLELLAAAQQLFGAAAAEKLLLVAYQQKAEEYQKRLVEGSLLERARALARIRDGEGYMAEMVESEDGRTPGQWKIIECHSPVLDVLRAFPILAKLEAELFSRLLQTVVQREETSVSGLYRATFSRMKTSGG